MSKKTSKRLTLRKLNQVIHLWLGLASGVVVFIVSITGCLYVFKDEIRYLTEPYQHIDKQQTALLPPSTLKDIATSALSGKSPLYLEYRKGRRSAIAYYYDYTGETGIYYQIFINPYSGEVLHVKDVNYDFFEFIVVGHRFLWLPRTIGRPVVGISTLIFIAALITGLVWWWPKKWNRSTIRKSFQIKWSANWKRINLDLHNVPGFYSLIICLILAITGVVYSFSWVSTSVYWITSGGKSIPMFNRPKTDTLANWQYQYEEGLDRIWAKLVAENPDAVTLKVDFPNREDAPFTFDVMHTYRRVDYYHFDQRSLEELPASGIFSGRYSDGSFAQRLRKLNAPIHEGAALGIVGKVVAFIASLIAASLPITGFIIWYNRKWGKKRKKTKGVKLSNKDNSIDTTESSRFTPQVTIKQRQAIGNQSSEK